jgi:multidrug efflux system membrane fusion protein
MKLHRNTVLIGLLLVAAVVYWRHSKSAVPGQSNAGSPMGMGGGGPAPVDVAKVVQRDVVEWDEFSARLESVDAVQIRPRVEGVIESVHFTEGQLVKKGQALFTIDPRPFETELSRAEANLAAASAQTQLAEADLRRGSKLFEEKAISAREFDQFTNAAGVARASQKAAEASLQQAKLNLDYTSITAPVNGRVGRAELTIGNLVNTGSNAQVLTSIVSLDPIYAAFDLDEQTYVNYLNQTAGNSDKLKAIPVTLQLGGGALGSGEASPPANPTKPDQAKAEQKPLTYTGRLQSFDNQLRASSGTIRVRTVFNNPNGLLIPGMFAKVRIGGGGKHPTILVNERAVMSDQNRKFVFVLDQENKAVYRPITTGSMVDGLRIVRTGLTPEDSIIVNGLQKVRPNAVVVPKTVAMESL